jgi:hypothetical protein
MGNVLCNEKSRTEELVCDTLHEYETNQCENIKKIRYLEEEIEMFRKKNCYLEERVCTLQDLVDDGKELYTNQINEIERVSNLLSLRQKGNSNLVAKLRQKEEIIQYFKDFVNTDDCILVNGIIQNTPMIECDWFTGSMFDKSEFIEMVVQYYKGCFQKVLIKN